MSSDRARRQADLFYADLMGLARPNPHRRSGRRVTEAPTLLEDFPEQDDWDRLKSGRVVFYDEDTLRLIEGWSRADGLDRVVLVNRSAFDPIRANGRKRSRDYDNYLRRTLAGERDLQAPLYAMESSLHTGPLVRGAPGDWDDVMISRLMAAGRAVSIQSESDQWKVIRGLFNSAMQDARNAATTRRPAREFVAFFVLDTVRATLTMVAATNVKMVGNDAEITVGRVRGTNRLVLPGGDAAQRVIGDVHTHVLLDPLIDLSTTNQGTTIRSTTTSLVNGVSDVDVASARNDGLVVYAIDSKWLHRANPNGSKNDKLPRSGNLLREALRIFGGEP